MTFFDPHSFGMGIFYSLNGTNFKSALPTAKNYELSTIDND